MTASFLPACDLKPLGIPFRIFALRGVVEDVGVLPWDDTATAGPCVDVRDSDSCCELARG